MNEILKKQNAILNFLLQHRYMDFVMLFLNPTVYRTF